MYSVHKVHVCYHGNHQVGYGDMVPDTALGKVVTSGLFFCSMVFLALPMTIIVSKFNKAFETLRKPRKSGLRIY